MFRTSHSLLSRNISSLKRISSLSSSINCKIPVENTKTKLACIAAGTLVPIGAAGAVAYNYPEEAGIAATSSIITAAGMASAYLGVDVMRIEMNEELAEIRRSTKCCSLMKRGATLLIRRPFTVYSLFAIPAGFGMMAGGVCLGGAYLNGEIAITEKGFTVKSKKTMSEEED